MPEEDTKQKKKKLSRKAKVRLSVFGILLIIVLIIVYVVSLLNRPEVAQLQAGQSSKSNDSYQVDLTPVLKTGKYISFDYPKGMLVDPTQIAGQIVEEFKFSTVDVESWELGIDVQTSRFGKLTDSTAYSYRLNTPTQYSESHETVNGLAFDIMTDKTAPGFNEVAFIFHNNLIVSVALLGDDTKGVPPLVTTFNMVLGSLHWLK